MAADPLSDILSLMKPTAYGFRGLDVRGDWSLHLPADAVLRCYAIRSGRCGLWLDGVATGMHLQAGDFVLLPHGHALVLGSRRDAPRIDLERFFATEAGATAVVDGGGDCSGFGGYFELDGMAAAAPLLRALPPVVRLDAAPDQAGLRWLVERLMGELRQPRPGGRLIAEHLSQTLLAEALRLHLERGAGDGNGGGWLAVLADPRLARALDAIHADPGGRWTLAALARIAGMSRSAFAQRFGATCGEPAIGYLVRWRMLLASDRLARGEPIGTVARALGYDSESAFGAAFRRVTGTSPGRLRPGRGGRISTAGGRGPGPW